MGPSKADDGLQVAGDNVSTGEHAVVATPEQLFIGLRVRMPSIEVQCNSCGTHLGEGDALSVYAYRTVETPRWHLAQCRYSNCVLDKITMPTLGVTEVCVSARLAVVSDAGTQQHRLCFPEPTVTTVSPPQHGMLA